MSSVTINMSIIIIYSLLTAIHSLRSSPSGSMTACLRFPLPSVASACFSSSYWWEPSGMFFFGLKVFDERLPLQRATHTHTHKWRWASFCTQHWPVKEWMLHSGLRLWWSFLSALSNQQLQEAYLWIWCSAATFVITTHEPCLGMFVKFVKKKKTKQLYSESCQWRV